MKETVLEYPTQKDLYILCENSNGSRCKDTVKKINALRVYILYIEKRTLIVRNSKLAGVREIVIISRKHNRPACRE